MAAQLVRTLVFERRPQNQETWGCLSASGRPPQTAQLSGTPQPPTQLGNPGEGPAGWPGPSQLGASLGRWEPCLGSPGAGTAPQGSPDAACYPHEAMFSACLTLRSLSGSLLRGAL